MSWMNGSRARLVAVLGGVAVACFAGASVAGGSAETAATKTRVNMKIKGPFPVQGGQIWDYKVKVKPRKCRKRRKVVIFHDENENGKLDKGEFVIGTGKTNRRGKVTIESSDIPPVGDRAVAFVKGKGKCKSGKDSDKITEDHL